MASSSSSSPEISSQEPGARFSYKDATEEEVLDDLSSRFILNLPDEELASLERLCFQVEQAHWFYEDFIREENTNLPSYNLKRFSEMLFKACPLLQQWSHDHEQAFSTFMQYKTRVPVCGAIMLNDAMDKCVLVKGWKASSGWGFPKGKINEDEHPRDCAVREVLEETGYNLASQINADDYFEMSIKEQKIALYVVPGVPEDFSFKTKTRKEISKIEWFKLSDLPTWKRNKAAPGRFYLISPFINPLKKFINQRKPRNAARKNGKQKTVQLTVAHSNAEEVSRHRDHIQGSSSASETVDHANNPEPPARQPEAILEQVQMDPQLARLFTSLVKSAAAPVESITSESQSKTTTAVVEFPSTGPVPKSTPGVSKSRKTFLVEQAAEHPDWSSSTPSYSQQAELAHSPERHTLVSQGPVPPFNTEPPPPPPPSFANGNINYSNQNNNLPSNPAAALPIATSPTSPISPTSSRKSTSTADISPYLSRQKEVPSSAKMLQQLSLLEAVADESARMAPIIAARAAMVSREPVPAGYPNQSASIPLQGLSMREPNGPYSFAPGPPASAAGFHPRYPMENPMHAFQDPFQVRSRTSQAFHRGPIHNPTGSVSMNQNHLLAAMNDSRVAPVSPNYQMGPQFMPQQPQPQMFRPGSQFYGAANQMQFQPVPAPVVVHGYGNFPNAFPPPPPQPASIRPYSTVNPNLAVITTPPNAQSTTALSLLSILNGRPTQQTTVPAPGHQ